MSNSQGPKSDCEHVSSCAVCGNFQRGHQFKRRLEVYDTISFYCVECEPTPSSSYLHDCISEIDLFDSQELPHSEGCLYDLSWADIYNRFKIAATTKVDIKIDRFRCARLSCNDPFALRWSS
jgi:hypothetical protein